MENNTNETAGPLRVEDGHDRAARHSQFDNVFLPTTFLSSAPDSSLSAFSMNSSKSSSDFYKGTSLFNVDSQQQFSRAERAQFHFDSSPPAMRTQPEDDEVQFLGVVKRGENPFRQAQPPSVMPNEIVRGGTNFSAGMSLTADEGYRRLGNFSFNDGSNFNSYHNIFRERIPNFEVFSTIPPHSFLRSPSEQSGSPPSQILWRHEDPVFDEADRETENTNPRSDFGDPRNFSISRFGETPFGALEHQNQFFPYDPSGHQVYPTASQKEKAVQTIENENVVEVIDDPVEDSTDYQTRETRNENLFAANLSDADRISRKNSEKTEDSALNVESTSMSTSNIEKAPRDKGANSFSSNDIKKYFKIEKSQEFKNNYGDLSYFCSSVRSKFLSPKEIVSDIIDIYDKINKDEKHHFGDIFMNNIRKSSRKRKRTKRYEPDIEKTDSEPEIQKLTDEANSATCYDQTEHHKSIHSADGDFGQESDPEEAAVTQLGNSEGAAEFYDPISTGHKLKRTRKSKTQSKAKPKEKINDFVSSESYIEEFSREEDEKILVQPKRQGLRPRKSKKSAKDAKSEAITRKGSKSRTLKVKNEQVPNRQIDPRATNKTKRGRGRKETPNKPKREGKRKTTKEKVKKTKEKVNNSTNNKSEKNAQNRAKKAKTTSKVQEGTSVMIVRPARYGRNMKKLEPYFETIAKVHSRPEFPRRLYTLETFDGHLVTCRSSSFQKFAQEESNALENHQESPEVLENNLLIENNPENEEGKARKVESIMEEINEDLKEETEERISNLESSENIEEIEGAKNARFVEDTVAKSVGRTKRKYNSRKKQETKKAKLKKKGRWSQRLRLENN